MRKEARGSWGEPRGGRGAQGSPAEPRGAQGAQRSPKEPRGGQRSQGSRGANRRAQRSPGEPVGAQGSQRESPGESGEPEEPRGAREAQGNPGEPREPRGAQRPCGRQTESPGAASPEPRPSPPWKPPTAARCWKTRAASGPCPLKPLASAQMGCTGRVGGTGAPMGSPPVLVAKPPVPSPHAVAPVSGPCLGGRASS